MIIVCCGMRRSASTLQYQLASDIVEHVQVGKRIGWLDSRTITFSQAHSARLLVCKVHGLPRNINRWLSRGKAKCIYIHRDLRDVAMSIMHKRSMTFDRFMRTNILNAIMREHKACTGASDVLCSRYEDTINDIPTEATRIATYLGLTITQEYAEQLGAECSLDAQLKKLPAKRWDKATLLHTNHIYSGAIGQYKSLHPDELNRLENVVGKWLVANNYV